MTQHGTPVHSSREMKKKKIIWPYHTAFWILVPQPGIEPMPPALEAWSLNHWTTREVPEMKIYVKKKTCTWMYIEALFIIVKQTGNN